MLKIIIDHRDPMHEARAIQQYREAEARKLGYDVESLPAVGRGRYASACDNCGDSIWVMNRYDTNYCQECKPVKQNKKMRGFG